jgi:hypothetical protein
MSRERDRKLNYISLLYWKPGTKLLGIEERDDIFHSEDGRFYTIRAKVIGKRRHTTNIEMSNYVKYFQIPDRLQKKGRKILEENDPKKKSKAMLNIHMVFWMVASMAVYYYTDFYMAIKVDPRVYR